MTWTTEDLDRIGGTGEVDIATVRRDGTLRSYLPVWIVRVGDDPYVRSYRGPGGSWFRQVRNHPHAHIRGRGFERRVLFEEADGGLRGAVDAAYRDKYGSGMYVDAMIAPAAADTTLRLIPGGD